MVWVISAVTMCLCTVGGKSKFAFALKIVLSYGSLFHLTSEPRGMTVCFKISLPTFVDVATDMLLFFRHASIFLAM